jgi:hypothetical protein
MDECEACGGPLALLGTLGSLEHSRCRHCGWVQGREVEEPPYLDEEDERALDRAWEKVRQQIEEERQLERGRSHRPRDEEHER